MTESARFLVALGGGDEIGASSYLLGAEGKRVLVDAGLRLKGKRHFPDYDYISQVGMVGLDQCDAVLVTHAHMDHTGSLPAVFLRSRGGARDVPIFMTAPTRDIAAILLNDTLKIKVKHGAYVGDLDVRKFERSLTEQTMEAVRTVEFDSPFQAAPGIQVTFYRAGHILGASMILVEIGEFRVLFSGDFCGDGQGTVRGYKLARGLPAVDVLVCETTYAYKGVQTPNIAQQQRALLKQIAQTIERKGKVLIPAFAVGRSQEVLLLLQRAMAAGEIKRFPVWSDGMVNQVCTVYNQYRSFVHPSLASAEGQLFFNDDLGICRSPIDLQCPAAAEQLLEAPPCCIVASSGMMVSGSCSAKYAEHLIEDPINRILFTGYLDEESPGTQLLNQGVSRSRTIRLNQKDLQVKAEIEAYHLSAHANLKQIISLVEEVQPQQAVFVHGYPDLEGSNSLGESFFKWGRAGIIPHLTHNNTPIYF